ncbi:MAG: F0F1 ATP synthase subunit B [Clostridia bacterium]|nr:F0F1 ATP synthase subunit B [Clostridia bacterium]
MQVQSLDVISVNIWHIVISLANLVLLFLLVKKFLYKPVLKVMEARRREIQEGYDAADAAQAEADANKAHWDEKMLSAQEKADAMIQDAADTAKLRSNKILADAKDRADSIVAEAQTQAALERKNAEAGIRREIAVVSTEIAEKMLEREINDDDHRQLIDSFLEKIGDAND